MDALTELIKKEGWEVVKEDGVESVIAFDQKFPKVHPFAIHAKLYREIKNPERKYLHMKSMHDYLWPHHLVSWHYWTERRFREHCEGWNTISYAGGAATTKSHDAAKIGLLFWFGNQKGRAVVVASTTLEGLEARVWGYTTKLLKQCALRLPYQYVAAKPPKILYERAKSGEVKDTIHGMFAVAANRGDDEQTIRGWIGRHPDEALMVILDEATDMPPAILTAIPNLESGVEFFQIMAIGNSCSKFDMHGAMSTPKHPMGWKSVDPLRDNKWETTQKNGICLFFSCYESPAVLETDPVKKAILGKFLITTEKIKEKESRLGKDSDAFWRFVLGFWRNDSTDDTIISRQFVENFRVDGKAEWSGLHPLTVVGGLDPAFSTGGDKCILRLAILGQATNGQIVLDYQGDKLLFHIKILANSDDSAELQIAKQVLKILGDYRVSLKNLCCDANGQGRALSEVIKLQARSLESPIKIYAGKQMGGAGGSTGKSFDVVYKSNHELWFAFREFIQHGQIKGLDYVSTVQLTTRLVEIKGGKPCLELKSAYKSRMGAIMPSLAHSPDEADAASLALCSAMMNFGFSAGQRRDVNIDNNFVDSKMNAFLALRRVEEKHALEVVKGPPVADFTGDVGDIKFGGF